MLSKSKKHRLLTRVKEYHKKYLSKKMHDLDESGTRLMINSFLTEVLGFASIEEVKTEYMIKGTYADYVIQTRGTRHFLVEVKSLALNLTDKHLRQAVSYGANEGIEWALLTNGRNFDLYRIIFGKPIESRKVLSIDLSDVKCLKDNVEHLQHLHRDSVLKRGLERLWNKCRALDPVNISGLLSAPQITNFLRRALQRKFRAKFEDGEVIGAVKRVIHEAIPLEGIKQARVKKKKRTHKSPVGQNVPATPVAATVQELD